jgi:pimeloyl-ACP methyl ester carboxylesterase
VGEVFNAFPDLVGALGRKGYLVAAPLGRGDTFYRSGPGELDVLEAIADVRRHYAVDPDRIFLIGFSGGAAGVNVISSRHPDLFAGAISVGATFEEPTLVDNIGTLPWLGLMAEGDPVSHALDGPGLYQALSDRGGDATLVRYVAKTHEFSLVYDSIPLIVDFVDGHRRQTAPPRIMWTVKPNDARPDLGLDRGGAWWLHGVEPTDQGAATTVAVRSWGLGRDRGDPARALRSEEVVDFEGRSGRSVARLFTTRPQATEQAARNRLDVATTNVRRLAVDLTSCGLDTDSRLTLQTSADREVQLTLHGVDGDASVSIDGSAGALARAAGNALVLVVPAGNHTIEVVDRPA